MTLAETEAALFANQLLPANWLLSDAQLSLRTLTNSPALELRTDRIFLERRLTTTIESITHPSPGTEQSPYRNRQ